MAAKEGNAPAGEKRKADEPEAAPLTKEAKVEGKPGAEVKAPAALPSDTADAPPAATQGGSKDDEEMQDVVPEVEHERDAPDDKRKRVDAKVQFHPPDTTLNVVPTTGGRVLMSLTEGGMQYLVAGARGSIGVKAGRYMYEARVIESLNPMDLAPRLGSPLIGRPPAPRQLVRLGFSTEASSHFLGDTEDSICFDSEGYYVANMTRSPAGQKFAREVVLGVVLNLDKSSENANTVSLFIDGKRASKPQKLPEHLVGKALFPHVVYRNVTMQLNFGPPTSKPMPFKCRPLQDVAQQDAVVLDGQVPKDGKYEVLFPVFVPGEGGFDWLDAFLEKHPSYVELSDRMILRWASKSGIHRPAGYSQKVSNDKPEMSFGLPSIDDLSVQRILRAAAPTVPRNYVVMEIRTNLLQADRKEYIQRFGMPVYRKVLPIIIGEPPNDHKEWVRGRVLQEKQEKADTEYQCKLEAAEIRQKKIEAGKNAEGKLEDEALLKLQKEVEEETPLVKPKAELTDEEQKSWFVPRGVPDLTEAAMSASCSQFAFPSEDEGFDIIRFEWLAEPAANEHFKKWLLQSKLTTRMLELQPSVWFTEKLEKWNKTLQEWYGNHKTFREPAKLAARKKKQEETTEANEGDAPEAMDIFSVEDVSNIGDDEPLFGHFEHEDWSLLSLRYELHLLVQAFKHDTDDPERPGIHESHVAFYFEKYFRKTISPKFYGLEEMKNILALVKDTISINATNGVIESQLMEDVDTSDIFVKLTEESRRERQRRIDAGDETAKLKFMKVMPQATLALRSVGVNGSSAPTWGQARPNQQGGWQQQQQQQQNRAALIPGAQGGVWFGGANQAKPNLQMAPRWQVPQAQSWQQAQRTFPQGGGGWR